MPLLAAKPGLAVSVFAGLHINRYLPRIHSRAYRHYFGVRVPATPRLVTRLPSLNALALRAFDRAVRPEIHHETYYSSERTGGARLRVLTVYDMIHERFPDQFGTDPIVKAKHAAVLRADAVIAISHSTKKDLVEHLRIPEQRVFVVHLANSLEEKAPARRGGAPYFLFVGHRAGYKNFELLLAALQASPLARDYDVLAFGGPAASAQERAVLSKRFPSVRVRFDSGDDRALAAAYAGAAALIYPSAYEGFGLPLLESMRHGCPVICSPNSSLSEVGGPDAVAYFPTGDVEALRHQLERVASDSTFRQRLIEAGKVRERAFSWSRCADETQAVYRRLA